MTDLINHEEALVKAFITLRRQERYLEFIASPKKRTKLIAELAHFKALDPRFMVRIPPSQQHVPEILKLLIVKGAGSKCWVISENRKLDGQVMVLETALQGNRWISNGDRNFVHTRQVGVFRGRG